MDALGLFLQNRGASLSLDPAHPNHLAPGKRPRHTLMPALICNDGGLCHLLGTRGGDGQAQTLAQLIIAMLDFDLDPQEAIIAPRWVWGGPTSARRTAGLVLESRFPEPTVAALRKRGYSVAITEEFSPAWMGSAQAIFVDRQAGLYRGGADPRSGGRAAGV